MFISIDQLRRSAEKLRNVHPFFGFAFLGFKRAGLPVGRSVELTFSSVMDQHLRDYFQPITSYPGYYNPFFSSHPSQRWVKPRYASTTLQRVTVDTFGDCFFHKKGTSEWTWRSDYVARLLRHISSRLPALDLAVWLFRQVDLGPSPSPNLLVEKFASTFLISRDEWSVLFDPANHNIQQADWVSKEPLTEEEFLDGFGRPPGVEGRRNSLLKKLETRFVGPAEALDYFPSERLNVITGDNSVGKTFLLDAVWWSLTHVWAGESFQPSVRLGPSNASIRVEVTSGSGRASRSVAKFDWKKLTWDQKGKAPASGLVIYSKFDGSFVVWDPASALSDVVENYGLIYFSPAEVKIGKSDGRSRIICNGMYRDWVAWQTNPSRFQARWSRFREALTALSPPGEAMEPGEPTRLPPDELEIPTIRFGYGDVPVTQASAAVSRVVTLAYVLVWCWSRHEENSLARRIGSDRRIVLIVDEIESHLHPKWQRAVLPALARAVQSLAVSASAQVHVSTHSPLVLASLESIFDSSKDSLFHLELNGGSIILKSEVFAKQGRVDRWLTHPIFGLSSPRSIEGEQAIGKARQLLLEGKGASKEAVSGVDQELTRALAEDDDFWPRWLSFQEMLKE